MEEIYTKENNNLTPRLGDQGSDTYLTHCWKTLGQGRCPTDGDKKIGTYTEAGRHPVQRRTVDATATTGT